MGTDTIMASSIRGFAKFSERDLAELIRTGKVDGSLQPLEVEMEFAYELRAQTEEQGGNKNLLSYRLALIKIKNEVRENNFIHSLDEIISDGFRMDKRPTDIFDFWQYDSGRLLALENATFQYTWNGEKILSPLLIFQAVEELIKIMLTYKSALKSNFKSKGKGRTVTEAAFKNTHILKVPEQYLDSSPVLFYKDNLVIYVEESSGSPKDCYSIDCDSNRIKFLSDCSPSTALERGLHDWYRIARFKYDGKNYGVFFLKILITKTFHDNLGIESGIRVRKYTDAEHKNVVKGVMDRLCSINRSTSTFNSKPEWFDDMIKVYLSYKSLIYRAPAK